jgi:hypothetical protein
MTTNFHDNIMEATVPYTRTYRRFYLTPPSVPLFVISVLLAIVALVVTYGHFTSIIHASQAFLVLVVAYIILLIGVLVRGI